MTHEEMKRVVNSLAKSTELLSRTTKSLAATMLDTRAELEALRIVHTGVLASLSLTPGFCDIAARTISAAIDGDSAVMLNTAVTDEQLQKRTEWMLRLMPAPLRQAFERLPR